METLNGKKINSIYWMEKTNQPLHSKENEKWNVICIHECYHSDAKIKFNENDTRELFPSDEFSTSSRERRKIRNISPLYSPTQNITTEKHFRTNEYSARYFNIKRDISLIQMCHERCQQFNILQLMIFIFGIN